MTSIPPIQGLATPAANSLAAPSDNPSQSKNLFEHLLAEANNLQKSSDEAIQSLVTGQTDNVQQVVMEVIKSEMSFQMFMEVRNQLINSYNELMRMQF